MTLIERIALRFGFERPQAPRPMTELVVFRTHQDAQRAGFRGSVHPKYPEIKAWWPGAGMRGLAMRPIQRVTIPNDMDRVQVEGEGRLYDILRARQRVYGDAAVWIDV